MAVDRYTLGLAYLVGGEAAVQAELREHRAGEHAAELVARAATDAAAAARAGGPSHTAIARALAEATGVDRASRRRTPPAGQARGSYAPRPNASVTTTIVTLRAAGASLPVIAEKVDRPYTTVRNTIARYERGTGAAVTPDRVLGRDGKRHPARHTPPPGGVTT